MAETVSMPKLGFDMAEGNLVRWLKKVNEKVEKGQVLAEIETDKATVEVESPFTGVVLQLIVDEGTDVPVGDPIAIIGAAGEKVATASTPAKKPPETEFIEKSLEQEPSGKQSKKQTQELEKGNLKIIASPLARRIAGESSIDLSKVTGTGPGGRIVRKDVEAALAGKRTESAASLERSSLLAFKPFQQQEIPGDKRTPINKLRAAIGRRMQESKQSVPHFYVTSDIDIKRLLDIREQINSLMSEDLKLSINDYVIKAVALTLRQYPNINSSIDGNELLTHGHIHIGVAVSVEGGLLTIVVKNADQKDLREISRDVKEMAGRVRSGKVKTDDIEGSTFSISNLGMFDVENFAAIINPPEGAILAVGSARDSVVVEAGLPVVSKMMKITISADHRITDGVEAAQFMKTLKQKMELPAQLLVS
jgi:pyruvate dehydrogenase E2 component (dihydrolipoamide acetyltransferase)